MRLHEGINAGITGKAGTPIAAIGTADRLIGDAGDFHDCSLCCELTKENAPGIAPRGVDGDGIAGLSGASELIDDH